VFTSPSQRGEARGAYRFGDFQIDLDRQALSRDGSEIRLRPKSFAVLVYLLEHQGRVVGREELVQSVWGHTHVTEDSLTQCLIDIRRALDDGAHEIVRTVPRRGYILEPDVRPVVAHGATWPRYVVAGLLALALSGAWWWLEGSKHGKGPISAATSGPLFSSLAVLPLENLAGDPAFVDAMTEQLTSELSRLPGLVVVSRSSVMQYRAHPKPVREVAKELGVEAVLEGSVWAADNRVRISVQLIDGKSEAHLWAREYVRDFSDVLAMQRDVAHAVAGAIQVSLTPEKEEYFNKSPKIKPAAQRAYLRGLYDLSRYRLGDDPPETILKSIESFKRAVAIEPEWADAWAKLAGAYHWSASSGASGPEHTIEHYRKSKAAARRALELDETVADAHGALAFVLHFLDLDWAGAEREYHRALELEPNNMHYRWAYGMFLQASGHYEEAVATFPVDQEPLSRILREQYSWSLACAGRYAESMAAMDDFAKPGSKLRDYLQANIELALGSPAQAIGLLEPYARQHSLDNRAETLAYAYAVDGREADARALLPELEAKNQYMPEVYAALGDTDKAMAQLEDAWARHRSTLSYMRCLDTAGYADLTRFKGLRDDPRFQALLKRIAFP